MEKRYTALRIIGTIYKVLGVIVGIVALLGVIGLCLTAVLGGAALGGAGQQSQVFGALGGAVGGILAAIITAVYGAAVAITLYAMGEGVYLLINVEENTRATMLLLEQRNRQNPPAA